MNQPTLLVLAAGMGSRYGGLKQLDPMGPCGETLLDYSIHDAVRAGFGDVVFVIRRDFEDQFREKVVSRYAGRLPATCVFQDPADLPDGRVAPPTRTKPWGTGHAILSAREQVTRPFLAINADDFYGAEAYEKLARHLERCDPLEFAMAGYRLRNTLSKHGSVSRGVCSVDSNGWLVAVDEFTKLTAHGTGAIHTACEGQETHFSGDEPVSLNFWGFTPDVFPLLEEGFRVFLDQNAETPTSEYYIPTAVAGMVSDGSAKVRAIETGATWFGVTYPQDRELAVSKLAQLTHKGLYPSPLWNA